jgi:transposase
VSNSLLENSEVTLPSDLESCYALIQELADLLASQSCELETKNSEILRLKQRLQEFVREKFGSRTEKLNPAQLALFGNLLQQSIAGQDTQSGLESDSDSSSDSNKKEKKHNGGGGRNPISPSIKRVRRDYYPEAAELVCDCGEQKEEIGTETVEQLDYIPASFVAIESVTHKFACKSCQEGVVEGKRPKQIHNGGRPAEGLIAQIGTAKYADHMPLYRQEQQYAREGMTIDRVSMGRWLEYGAAAAKPLVARMRELVMQSAVVQVDESPVKFIDLKRKLKKIKTGYAWVAHGDSEHPYTIYDIQPDRSKERAQKLLEEFDGILLTDGYGGYEWYERGKSANCNVHARRYCEKALKYDKQKAGLILALYGKLYEIEERIKGLEPEQILVVRQAESMAILDQIKKLFEEWRPSTPPKTPLGLAISYSLARWDKLCRFTEYGYLPLDTNLVENAIRPLAVGRKNWLQVGSEESLETASVFATLVNTCKRLKVNPYLYLRDIFIRLGAGVDSIDSLLPDRWINQNPLDALEKAESKAATVD